MRSELERHTYWIGGSPWQDGEESLKSGTKIKVKDDRVPPGFRLDCRRGCCLTAPNVITLTEVDIWLTPALIAVRCKKTLKYVKTKKK